MRFELKVALRYLRSSRLQTALIFGGVAVGIIAYTFMAALINGLAERLTDDVIGNIAHVVLLPRERVPERIDGAVADGEGSVFLAVQRANDRRAEITGWQSVLATVLATPGVTLAVPEVQGGGFVQRGEKVMSVSFTGTVPAQVSAIVDLESNIVTGSAALGSQEALIGIKLADELGLAPGQRLILRSERGGESTLLVRGVFDIGNASLNERVVYTDLATAQSLMGLDGTITRLEVEVDDLYAAPQIAARLAGATGLEARDWISENKRLQEALVAQGSTGTLIKFFSMLTIIIGVASVLLLAAMRRRGEIGIMRSFGVSKRSISAIFILQGALIGLLGSGLGALLGWTFCEILLLGFPRPDGRPFLPIDAARGEYATAILLATLASSLAAIAPARSAARVDPVEVIQQ